MPSFKDFLTKNIQESSLSRVFQHTQDNAFGIITAFRADFSKNENLKRNKSLESDLRALGFGFTKVKGSYPEVDEITGEAKRVEEQSLIVFNTSEQSSKDLKDALVRLGKKYNQDSVLIKERETEIAYLAGTNDTGFPGLGKTEKLGKWTINKAAEYYTRMRGDRKFTFESVYHSQHTYARKILSEMGVENLWVPISC